MANQLAKGPARVGGTLTAHRFAVTGDANALGLYTKSNTVARTDTAAKDLFTLPAGAIPRALRIYGAAASNAVTTATLSVGKTGTAAHFLSAFDVKTAGTGAGQVVPNAALNLHTSVGAAAITVIGTYAETGGASSSGGAWTVAIDYSLA